MIGAGWKLIIFTSMVKRLINTSRNERVTLQVYDTCLQMFLFFGLQRKDCFTHSTLSSDTRGRPALFPLQRHPRCLKLLLPASNAIGRWGITVELSPEWPAEQKQLIHASQIAVHKTPSAPESPLSLCYVTDRERRGEWVCACVQNLNTCCFVPCGKLTSACVLIAVMADSAPPCRMGLSNNPTCRKCGTEEETSVHILYVCEALASLRRTYLGSFFLDLEDIRKLGMRTN